MKKLLFVYLLLISVVFADVKFYEENMNGFGFCSANFLILSTAPDPVIKRAYQQAGQLALKFTKIYYKEVYKKDATPREISKLRTTYLNRLEQEYKRLKGLSNTTYEKIGKCESFVRTVLDNQDTIEVALTQSKTNAVTKRRVLESLAYTNNPVLKIPRKKILAIYKNWIEKRAISKNKPATKFVAPNMKFMK